jgi:hypothetical protein
VGHVDLIRRFHDFAPETRSLLMTHARTHAHEILKTQEDNIITKYITYVYKSFNIGAPDINEEIKIDQTHQRPFESMVVVHSDPFSC